MGHPVPTRRVPSGASVWMWHSAGVRGLRWGTTIALVAWLCSGPPCQAQTEGTSGSQPEVAAPEEPGAEDPGEEEPRAPVVPGLAPDVTWEDVSPPEADAEPEPPPAIDPRQDVRSWEPPRTSTSEWDWLQIDTEEWVKGELLGFRGDVYFFDSDNFDEIELDDDEVVFFRLAQPRTFRLTGRRVVVGIGEMRDGVIKIRTIDGTVQEYPQSELVGITAPRSLELDKWTVRIGAGLSLRSGNSEQQDLTANALIRRDDAYTRWVNTYIGAFGRADGSRVVNNHRYVQTLDYLLTRDFYVTIPYLEVYSDEFQTIDARITPGAGVGYKLFDTPDFEWNIGGGAAAQLTEYETGNGDTDFAILGRTSVEIDLPGNIDLDALYALQFIPTDVGKTSHHTEVKLSIEIYQPVDLDVLGIWDRIENPERDSDGDRPDSDDFRLTVGLSIEY